MRKSTLLAAATAFTIGMFASGQVMAGQIEHLVSGGGMNTGFATLEGDWTYGFTAMIDVDDRVKGQAEFHLMDDSGIRVHAAITCLSVDEFQSQAVLSGIVVESDIPELVGTAIAFRVEDGGGFDRISATRTVTGNDPQFCVNATQDRIDALILEEWINGNVTVR